MQLNTFNGGMNMDFDPNVIPADKYCYAENVRIVANDEGSAGAITNSDGIEDIFQIDFTKFPYVINNDSDIACSLIYDVSKETIIHRDKIRNFGLIFTENKPLSPYDKNNGTLNRIFRIDFTKDPFTEPDEFFVKLAESQYNIKTPVSSSTIYESDTNIKVYWADGVHQIRSINIVPELAFPNDGAADYYITDNSSDSADIIPPFPKNKIIPDNIVSGTLLNGSYQYVYVLVTPSSVMTAASVPSDMIQLYPYANLVSNIDGDYNHSKQAFGPTDNTNSFCGIHMNVTLPYNMWSRYSYIRVYRLFYSDADSTPTCYLINTKSVTKGKNKEDVVMTFSDLAADAVTGESIKDLYSTSTNYKYSFAPRFLEQKNNMLFAANIKELSTSEDILGVSDNGELNDNGDPMGIDFRSYPFNINGEVKLANTIDGATTTYTIKDPSASNYITHIPRSSDCYLDHDSLTNHELISSAPGADAINSSFYGYRFYKDVNGNWQHCLGGSGHIVSYEFIVKQIIIDGNNGVEHNGLIQDNNFSIYKIKELSPVNASGVRNNNTIIGNFKADYAAKNIDTSENSLVNYTRTEYDSTISYGTTVNNEYEPAYSYNSITGTNEPFGYQTKQLEGRDYTNPFITASYKSLRRDEIYRYGIVFRSNGGTKTNVFWIGDIKTPCASVVPYFEHVSNDSECVIAANVLGIRFIIDFNKLYTALSSNLDTIETIDSYEIVRCKRGTLDRTIVASGIVQSVFPDAGINSRENKTGYYYQPTWFTSSNGRIDTFCPTRMDISKDGKSSIYKVDHTVNHGFKYDDITGSGTIYPNLTNAKLKYVGFISPDIEYNMNAFNSAIDVSSGVTHTKDTITNLLDNLSGIRLSGVISLSSAVSDSFSNKEIWLNRDTTRNYYTSVTKVGLSAIIELDLGLNVPFPKDDYLTTQISQNKPFVVKTMGALNNTTKLFGNSDGSFFDRETESANEFAQILSANEYLRGIELYTSQLTTASAGYVSDSGTMFHRRMPNVNMTALSFFGGKTGISCDTYLDGFVNSGCSDGSGCASKVSVKVFEVKYIYDGKEIAKDSLCGATSASLSGGTALLSRYYYPTGISVVKNATDSTSKVRNSGYSVISPSGVSMNIDNYVYMGVEKTSRGKWDSTGDPSSFYGMDGGDYFRNVSIMTYATGTWVDAYGEFNMLNLSGFSSSDPDLRIFTSSVPTIGMTGANIVAYDSTSADESTKKQKQRVRTCPSHGGMLYLRMTNSSMAENMIIGGGAPLKYGFINKGYTSPCDTPYDSTVVLVANLKRLSKNAYTGQTKDLRDTYSTYYSFGDIPHEFKNNGLWSIPLFYGDTYIGVFDYTSNYLTRDEANGISGTLNSTETNKLMAYEFGNGYDSPMIATYGITADMFSTETISCQHQAYIPIESDINIAISSQFDPHKNVSTFNGSSYGLMDNVKVSSDNRITDNDIASGASSRKQGDLVSSGFWNNYCTGVIKYNSSAHGYDDSHYNDTKGLVKIGYKFVDATADGTQYTCKSYYSAEPIYCSSVASLSITTTNATNSGTFDCRVLYSSPKRNNEVDDSYGIFTAADYLDVDTRYGPITGLFKFKNNLVFWQDTAFGYLPVLERTFMKSSNQNSSTGEAEIVLGTGSVLKSFDYYTIENGMSHRVINVDGDYKYVSGTYTASESSLYWYDHNKKEVVLFTGGTNPLSKAKGIQSFINKYCDEFAPRLSFDYDNKYNEVLMTFRTIDDDDECILGSIDAVFDADTYEYELTYKDTSVINDIITSTINGTHETFVVTSSPSWVSVSVVDDGTNSSINIIPTKNTTYYNRVGYIVLTQNRSKKTITITITQSLYNPEIVFSASPTSFTIPAASTTSRSSMVTSTIDGIDASWTASTTDSWITITTASGSNKGKVVFGCSANTSTSSRVGYITLTQSTTGSTIALTITQSGDNAGFIQYDWYVPTRGGVVNNVDIQLVISGSAVTDLYATSKFKFLFSISYLSNGLLKTSDVCITSTLKQSMYGLSFLDDSAIFKDINLMSVTIVSGNVTEDDNYFYMGNIGLKYHKNTYIKQNASYTNGNWNLGWKITHYIS